MNIATAQSIASVAASRALHQIITYTDFEMIWDTKPEAWRTKLTDEIADDVAATILRIDLEADADAVPTAEQVRGTALLAAIQYAETREGMSIGDVLYAAGRIESFMNRDHG